MLFCNIKNIIISTDRHFYLQGDIKIENQLYKSYNQKKKWFLSYFNFFSFMFDMNLIERNLCYKK